MASWCFNSHWELETRQPRQIIISTLSRNKLIFTGLGSYAGSNLHNGWKGKSLKELELGQNWGVDLLTADNGKVLPTSVKKCARVPLQICPEQKES